MRFCGLFLGLALASLVGCEKLEEIVPYTVAKPPARQHKVGSEGDDVGSVGLANHRPSPAAADRVNEADGEQQLTGAIIPRGTTTWFFKLTGPRAAVVAQMKPFVDFVKSIRFSEKGPEWTLPEGWSQEPASAMRFATLRIATPEKPLEMSVIPLPTGAGNFDDYLLSNINRWRDQMRLAPIAKEDLPEKTVQFEVEDTKATLVSFAGQLSQQPGIPPGGGLQSLPPPDPIPPTPNQNPPEFTSQLPEGWKNAQHNSMQKAAYEVRDGERQATISVSTARGSLKDNIDRWCTQVGLPPLDAATLEKEKHPVKVDGADGILVELRGPAETAPRKTILGVIVQTRGQQWFIKLIGDADLAAREKERFEEFVRSIRFRASN